MKKSFIILIFFNCIFIAGYAFSSMAFEKILIMSPTESRVKLEMARTFQRFGANKITALTIGGSTYTGNARGVMLNPSSRKTVLTK